MKSWANRNRLYLAGALVGALAGFLYWKFVGCASGTCLISNKPLNSTVYFAVMGSLFFGMFKKEKQQKQS
ncbi:hypothetical protein FRZ67_09190 [Panacibacter ginsenosidivorans]|uniref:YtxH domain-containing protein n=1 Tax=Panacibacter ginsenosidivorans TaxID=1813871 RepID=A0A5B8V7G3_9BACT|nr:hypothetical protein [Panacibacter ginsenosidivorans]QEC67460.1 hypothetical protein FRZ67_09190 [Panacibacter ginsenosidivorans]